MHRFQREKTHRIVSAPAYVSAGPSPARLQLYFSRPHAPVLEAARRTTHPAWLQDATEPQDKPFRRVFDPNHPVSGSERSAINPGARPATSLMVEAVYSNRFPAREAVEELLAFFPTIYPRNG